MKMTAEDIKEQTELAAQHAVASVDISSLGEGIVNNLNKYNDITTAPAANLTHAPAAPALAS